MDLSTPSLVILYVIVGIMDLGLIVLWGWQLQVFRGKPMENPDGSKDDWNEAPLCYGIALADMVIAVPTALVATVLMILEYRVGHYLFGAIAWWFVWVNFATTVSSIRFHKPKMSFGWLFSYPGLVAFGLAYLVWEFVHWDVVF